MSEQALPPLGIQLTQQTYSDLTVRTDSLDRIEEGLGEKFMDVLRGEIRELRAALAQEIATSDNGRINRKPQDEASTHYSRPVYRHAFATSKPRRRSSAGRYHLYFALTGGTNEGDVPDTLVVMRVLSAGGSNPFVFGSTDAGD